MELDITDFFNNACPKDYSASQAEIGAHAGAYTWHAACGATADYPILDTSDKRKAFREAVRRMGSWRDEEIATWTNIQLNALLIQFISDDMREAGMSPKWDALDWEAYSCRDDVMHCIFKGTDDRIYFDIGGLA